MFEFHSLHSTAYDNRNSKTTAKYWLIKVFEVLKGIQDDIVLDGTVYLDETYFSKAKQNKIKKDEKELRGISRNKIGVGVACNDKASNMEWPWDFAVDDERIFIIDKFHYFIRAVLEKNLPLQEYILKFMQFAEENPDTIVIADEIGNGIVPLDAFEREYREQTGRAEILLAKKADEVVRVICGIGQKIK